ncbi:MAG: PQQ-binding-like beta-propeller repeat protein [Alphaproteobacteria bacterium]|nr:PQQ-binding-like beta-propeller repeat protein [Alphaproteobacteria bacterium]
MFRHAITLTVLLTATAAQAQTPSEWLTFGYDAQRSGWNKAETTLSPKNVGRLKLLWSSQLTTVPQDVALSTLTAPLVAQGVDTAQGRKDLIFTIGIDDTLFAIDADSGKTVWQKTFPNLGKPQRPATTNCSNTEQATPVIDKAAGVIYFTTSDGKLRGLSLGAGEEKLAPMPLVAPFSRNWSLNLIDNVIYTASGRGCGGDAAQPIEAGAVSAMDISDPAHPRLSRFYTGRGRPAGPWGRGGPVAGPKGVYVQTADGAKDPAAGIFGNAVIAVAPKAYGVADSFTPASWTRLNEKDLDLGSGGPMIFPFKDRTLLVTSSKEGVVYLLDTRNLGGRDHGTPLYQSPRLGNDAESYWGQGVFGEISTTVTADGARLLYVPMWGPPGKDGYMFPPGNGAAPHGSVMALKVVADGDRIALAPAWMSRDLTVPDNIAVANGVVYAVQTGEQTKQHFQNLEEHGQPKAGEKPETTEALSKFRSTPVASMMLVAMDAATGKELYSSGKLLSDWVHFNQPAVALGKVFLVSHDAHVYAFGLKR